MKKRYTLSKENRCIDLGTDGYFKVYRVLERGKPTDIWADKSSQLTDDAHIQGKCLILCSTVQGKVCDSIIHHSSVYASAALENCYVIRSAFTGSDLKSSYMYLSKAEGARTVGAICSNSQLYEVNAVKGRLFAGASEVHNASVVIPDAMLECNHVKLTASTYISSNTYWDEILVPIAFDLPKHQIVLHSPEGILSVGCRKGSSKSIIKQADQLGEKEKYAPEMIAIYKQALSVVEGIVQQYKHLSTTAIVKQNKKEFRRHMESYQERKDSIFALANKVLWA